MADSTSGIAMQAALHLTGRAISTRATLFRDLVIAIVAVTLICTTWAALQLSWRPLLAGFVLLVPLYGMFLCLDVRLIDHWQQQILQRLQGEHKETDSKG